MRSPWATYVVNNTPNHNDIIFIQQYYSILLYDSLLLTTANNVGSTTLFNLKMMDHAQPRSQGLRGETVTKTLVKFVLSFQNFREKIASAVRHNRYCNTVVSHYACDFFPKILER